MALRTPDLEVRLKSENHKAVIEGKTTVPFKTFVKLTLQRKVIPLFTEWGEEPIILSSELLTDIASAPQDSQENRAHLVTVTLGVGVLVGVFCSAIGLAVLESLGYDLGVADFFVIAGVLLGLALLSSALVRVQSRNRSQKIADSMEKLASMLSK